MIGKMNGEHWYLYITGPNTQLTPPHTPPRGSVDGGLATQTRFLTLPEKNASTKTSGGKADNDVSDETLEILMTDLDVENARQFYLEPAASLAESDYLRKAHEARVSAIEHLGVISENNGSDVSISGRTLVDGRSSAAASATFDVFEQTSSDHSDLASPDGDLEREKLTFPEELTTEGHTLGTVVSDSCGLADIYPTLKYPDARIDAYLFTPCGFSANGVIPAPEDAGSTHYFTVHVTPEPQCSYASFETNVPASQTGRETVDVVAQVVSIFKPGRFSVTLFEAKDEDEGMTRIKKDKRMDSIKGYRRIDRVVHDLEGYELIFRHFEREDWKGGAPRLGEIGM